MDSEGANEAACLRNSICNLVAGAENSLSRCVWKDRIFPLNCRDGSLPGGWSQGPLTRSVGFRVDEPDARDTNINFRNGGARSLDEQVLGKVAEDFRPELFPVSRCPGVHATPVHRAISISPSSINQFPIAYVHRGCFANRGIHGRQINRCLINLLSAPVCTETVAARASRLCRLIGV